MEVITKFYQPWLEKWRNHRFQAILLICFFLWTPLLVVETLQVQNSCHPMIDGSKELPPECQSKQPKQLKVVNKPVITETKVSPPAKKPDWVQKPSEKTPPPGEEQPNKPIQESLKEIEESAKQHPDITGASIGIAFATGAAIANAPLVVTVGIGIALWLAIRTALSL